MRHLLITTIAVVLLMGCGPLQSNAKSLHRAAEEGDIEAVKKHLAAGANKNVRAGKWRDTPLHRAAFWGYTEVVELLINNDTHSRIPNYVKNRRFGIKCESTVTDFKNVKSWKFVL